MCSQIPSQSKYVLPLVRLDESARVSGNRPKRRGLLINCAYAFTDYTLRETRVDFYRELSRLLRNMSSTDVLVGAGSFNVQISCLEAHNGIWEADFLFHLFAPTAVIISFEFVPTTDRVWQTQTFVTRKTPSLHWFRLWLCKVGFWSTLWHWSSLAWVNRVLLFILIHVCGPRSYLDSQSLIFVPSLFSQPQVNHRCWTADSRRQTPNSVPMETVNAIIITTKCLGLQRASGTDQKSVHLAAGATQGSKSCGSRKYKVTVPFELVISGRNSINHDNKWLGITNKYLFGLYPIYTNGINKETTTEL